MDSRRYHSVLKPMTVNGIIGARQWAKDIITWNNSKAGRQVLVPKKADSDKTEQASGYIETRRGTEIVERNHCLNRAEWQGCSNKVWGRSLLYGKKEHYINETSDKPTKQKARA